MHYPLHCQRLIRKLQAFVIGLTLAFSAVAATATQNALDSAESASSFKLHAVAKGNVRRLLDVATSVNAAPPAGDQIYWDGFEMCGDGVIDSASEQCDRSDLGGATCLNAGFMSGVLACDATCHFDTTQCAGQCPVGCITDNDCGVCGPCIFGFCAF
jgi:hypothetical protein